MPNYVPYLVLIMITIPILIWVIHYTRQIQTLLFYLAFAGMIYFFEFVVVVLFNAYEYFPGILSNHYQDNMLGAVVSNTLAVPIMATFIATLRLRWYWISFFAFLFGGIEWLFLHLGVYEHHWWKISYTVISLHFFFWMTKLWIKRVKEGSLFFQYITYFMCMFTIVDTIFFSLAIFGLRRYHIGVFWDIYHDDTLFTFYYSLFKTFLFVNAMYWSQKVRWILLVWITILLTQYLFTSYEMITFLINPWGFHIIYMSCILIITILSYLSLRSFRRFSKT